MFRDDAQLSVLSTEGEVSCKESVSQRLSTYIGVTERGTSMRMIGSRAE